MITIHTQTSAGQPIFGYYITLWLNGMRLQSCYSTCSFIVSNGQAYQIAATGFGDETFSHWAGTTNSGFLTVDFTSCNQCSTSVQYTADYSATNTSISSSITSGTPTSSSISSSVTTSTSASISSSSTHTVSTTTTTSSNTHTSTRSSITSTQSSTSTSSSTSASSSSTTITISTTTSTTHSTTSIGSQPYYQVTFQQTPQLSACQPSYLSEWSVTLANTTKAQPPNAALPISDNHWNYGPQYADLATITFFVPNGNYTFAIHPSLAVTPSAGTVTVSGSNVLVQVLLPSFPCSTTTTMTTTTTTSSASG